MTLGGEGGAVQYPFVRYAEEAGWQRLSPDEALRLRDGGVMSPLLDAVLVEQLQRLNPGVVDLARAQEVAKRLRRVHPSIRGNQDAWEHLKGLKTVFVPQERRERNLRLLDPARPEANRFHVTPEFTFSNGLPPDIRADIVFFINGLPVIVVEAKSAKKLEGIAEAFDQIRYYHQKGPEFLALAQLHALTHLIHFHYGATWNLSRKGLFNWRDEQVLPADFESLCKSFVAPLRVLRMLTDFILFTRKDDELSKVVLRPHQMRAVERCLGRAKDRAKRRGLIWHTQGSGKTYTMITVAKKLVEEPSFQNPTVIMLVDRNELEAQLFGNLEAVGFGQVTLAASKEHLRELLQADRRGLIVSMIHKFDGLPERMSNRANIFVLVDEAHRTTGGDLGNYLMGALPQATYLGFTGTPIDRTQYGKGTFKVFGRDDEKGYLDKYSILESIADGTTVPLNYALAPNELQVDREVLDREFLALAEAEGVSDIEELNKVLEKAVTLRNMLKNPERVEQVARHVARHYQDNVEPMGYKAFLVAVDREACCLYKEALDRHLPPDYSTVVISQGGNKDPDLLRRRYLSEAAEQDVRKLFRKPSEKPKLLIVTEKLLTGFDAPVLYCLYLDKPMRDHVLLQAIARVNRPFEDDQGRRKPAGFVLDFVGIFGNLEKALAFDSQDVQGVIEGLDVLRERFLALMERGRAEYLPLIQGKRGDKQVEAVLEHFRDKERREEFYAYFKELQDVYEILSPDAFLRPHLANFAELGNMYRVLRASYDRGVILVREFLRKTAKLVQENTDTGSIEAPDKLHALGAKALEKIAEANKPDTVKVFNLLKAIHDLVQAKGRGEPYLVSIGDKAEEIAAAFEERQINTKEALEALERLVAELKEAEKKRDETGLSPEAFAVYWYLKREGVSEPKDVAERAGQAFEQYPYWQTSERQEQEVRKSLYKAMIEAGVEGVVDLGKKLFAMLRKAAQ